MSNKSDKKEKGKVLKVLKFFFPFAWRTSKEYFVLSAVNVILAAAAPFANIIFLPLLIDALMAETKDMTLILTYGGAMTLANVLLVGLNSALTVHLEKYRDYFINESFIELSMRSMELDFALTENKEALDRLAKAKDGLNYSMGVHDIAKEFFNIISNALKLLGTGAVLVASAPWLFLIIGASLILSTVLNGRVNAAEVKFFKALSTVNRAFGYIVFEMTDYRHGKDIRLYSAEDMMQEKTDLQLDRMRENRMGMEKTSLPYRLLDGGVISAKDFGTYLYLGVLAIAGKITVGTFSQLVTSAGTMSGALDAMIRSYQEIEKRCSYAYETVKFMEYPPYMEKGDRQIENLSGGHTIEFRHVSFAYPNTGVKVLNDVSITLHSGEKLSVVGLNGAGKTTFIKLLCRLYDTDSGEILLDGVNIREYDYDEYMKLFSVVFQDFRLLAFTVDDNILLGNTEPPETVESLLEKVGLEEKVKSLPKGRDTMMFKQFDKEGVELSGGEQQKLAIARALYKNAPVVILDEPTAALDPVAEYEIYKRFDELVGGKTAVYISHRLSSCKFCDRIAVFSEGTIKEYGAHDELLRIKDGIYAEMFKAQAQYYI